MWVALPQDITFLLPSSFTKEVPMSPEEASP